MVSDNFVEFDKSSMSKKFTENETNETITFVPAFFVPFINYHMTEFYSNGTTFKVYGPLMVLLRELAIMRGAWLKLYKPPESTEEMINYFMSAPPHFIATTVDAAQVIFFNQQLQAFDLTFSITNVIDYTDEARIAYKKLPGDSQIFTYFLKFEFSVIISIIFTIFIVSLILTLRKGSLINFFWILIDCISLLFNKEIPRSFQIKNLSFRLLIGAWLFASMFISILFCNLILDEKVKTVPMKVIDSWDDLYNRKEVEIFTLEKEFMYQIVKDDKSDMSLNFMKRIKPMAYEDSDNPELMKSLGQNISSGQTAFVNKRLVLIFYLIQMSKLNKDNGFLESLHVSNEGGPQLPYFMSSMLDSGHEYVIDMNKIISYSTDTGLYSKWKKDSLKDNGYIGIYDEPIKEQPFKFDMIILTQIIEEIYLLLSGCLISIFLLALEWVI